MALRYSLDNGLTVVFEPQHAAKVVAYQIWVKVGSADEREEEAGLAHLHEHMLFKGTQARGPGQIAKEIEAHGGEVNAWTSFDQTVYHTVLASQFARTGLDVLADAVRSSVFDAGELTREIEVVCEEIKRSTDMPSRRASRGLFESAYQLHPYRRPVLGWEHTVRSFTRDKVLAFFHRHYVPANMVLSVAGDVSEGDLRAWVDQALGGTWEGRATAPKVSRAGEPAPAGPRLTVKEDPAKEAYLYLAFPIPALDHPHVAALDLLTLYLGQGDASRLSLEVKRKRQLVNEIHASAYTPKDPGLLMVSLTATPNQVEAALEETGRVLNDARNHPIPADELATLKAVLEAEAVYQRETVQGLARKLGFYESSAGGIEREAAYYEQVAALTADEIREAARTYLSPSRAVISALVPSHQALDTSRAQAALESGFAKASQAAAPRKPSPAASTPLRVTAPLLAKAPRQDLVVERLSSGARVVVRQESAVPLFAVRAVFPGGLRYETEADNGLTTLLSRMLVRGTPNRDAEDISRQVDELAGSLSGTGGRNSVGMRGEFLSRHFDRAFDLFTECLTQPSFPEGEFERERHLQLQDVLTREDKPSGLAFDLFCRTLYQHHPYRLSSLGEHESLQRLTPGHLSAYHARHMDWSQLTLCVVGDVKVDQVLSRAEAAFGRARGGAAAAPQIDPEAPPAEPREARRKLDRAQSHVVLGFRAARTTDRWRYGLELLSSILSGQGGRLFLELRDKRSMAYSVSSFSVEGVDPGYFAVYIGTSPEKVDAALAGIREELLRVREENVTEEELRRAKEYLIGTHEIGLQRNSARAGLLALDYSYGLDDETFFHYSEHLSRVTAEEVRAVASRVIDFSASTLAVVGP